MGDKLPEKVQPAIRHGGNLGRARQLFPQAPEPWIDLSTGINPHSYPHSPIPASAFARLPEPHALETLKQVAATAFGAPSTAHLVAAPGTQMLMPLLAQMALDRGARRAAVLTPAYAEHARTARMAGLPVTEVADFADLSACDYAVVVNPNNPDGRVIERSALLTLAETMQKKGGLLVVDEAFIETGSGESIVDAAASHSLIVLRSFGKFYGMAGVRLGFAITHPGMAAELEARLGPWAVSGPALHIATEALGNRLWAESMRTKLNACSERLDTLLRHKGLTIAGGTSLFTLIRDESVPALHDHLMQHGILTRIFEERPADMRLGLPANEADWARLETALAAFNP